MTFLKVRDDEASRIAEFRRRIRATAALGSKLLDQDALRQLWQRASPLVVDASEPADAFFQEVHASDAYRLVARQLNEIRNTDKDLIKYVYVLRDGNPPRFLADADVLSSNPPPREELSFFGRTFKNANIEKLSAALRACEAHLERDFVPDPEYRVRSLSAYAPLRARDGTCLGIVGVDMTDIEVRKTIAEAQHQAWLYCLFMLVASFLAIVGVIYVFQKPWASLAKRITRLAGARSDQKKLRSFEELRAAMTYLEKVFETPTESVQRQASDAIVKLHGGPVTAVRVRHDVVPEYVRSTVPADAVLKRHDLAHCLVAGITGLSQAPNGSTNVTLEASARLYQQFIDLARKQGLYATMTTGDSVIAIGIQDVDAVLALAVELISAGKACAIAAQLPLSTVIGIDSGPVVMHATASGVLVDVWGEPLVNASVLRKTAPADRILLSAAAQQHNRSVMCREHRHAEDGRTEVFIVSTRNSQNRITQETTHAARDHGSRR